MIFTSATLLGALVLAGCAVIGTALDKIADEMKRTNDLKEAKLRSRNVAIAEPGSTAN
jgi:hypothetical protein